MYFLLLKNSTKASFIYDVLRATVGQNSSSVQMASANHVALLFWCTWPAAADWTTSYRVAKQNRHPLNYAFNFVCIQIALNFFA